MTAYYFLLGRLSFDALPFYSALATAAAAIAVAGAIAVIGLVTWLGKWRYLWREWFTSVDHKRIGVQYFIIAFVMLARALVEAILMRLQQADAVNQPGFVEPEHFAQLFSTHGTIMIFFVAMPLLTGVINFAMPLQIGARDVAFPLLNSISLCLTWAGAWLMMAALVLGRFSTGGWTGYPPYTGIAFSPGVGPDYWIWAVTLASIGSLLTGINFAVTLYKGRAPGMTWFHMPLFCWTALCTSILLIFAIPPLTVATGLLALDRYAGMHFFTNEAGGNVMNYANLFWLFGHPEVYILILPAFGVYSEVIATFSSKRLFGYVSLVCATMAIAVLSFTVWLHHFFTMGQSADVNAAFGIATMLIGIPTGVKVYDWIWTMFRGRIRFTVPMLYSLAFIVTFVIGGMTGIILAMPPLDYVTHNTVFLVAHFHNMLIPGLLFAMLAAYHYWFPKAFGYRLNEFWGRVSCACWVGGFYLAFMPLYVLGLEAMPRRSQQVSEAAYQPWLLIAAFGGLVLFCAFAALAIQLWVSIRDRDQNRVAVGDPWDARGLEWAISAPPPEYNFAVVPQVHGRDAFWQAKQDGFAYAPPDSYEAIEMPRNSAVGPVIGLAGAGCAFGLVWHIWWLALLGLAVAIGAVIARSFVRDTHRVISADEVAATEARWHAAIAAALPIERDEETQSVNHGLAKVMAG
ncbi:cbb3-type cytochrome c oxidase subunit I [Sphingomonas sp. PAMC 26605]|uniref:cbb3-type cytochrome c oxidase subunit I n=1 Tax=Sphingomonas sp. PAMC 26605 TaxID=1112214 RepID=UPI00026CD5DA|nr:cbb3-type cytochrome c oxidase subunit I [Sphingomonas sp. PAMC 26605]